MPFSFFNKKIFFIFVAFNFSIFSETNDSTNNMQESTKIYFGVVKFYNEDKGYGYIIDNDTKDELFVYEEGIIDEIYDNDNVKYNIRDTRKGLEAYNVRLR